MFYSPAFIFSSDYSLGLGFLAGLRLLVLRQFSAFLPALRRFRGTLLFRGLRSSSIWGFPFWLLGLTVQSSRPAFGRRLTFGVSLRKTRNIEAHVLFTGIYFLKRLFVGFWVSCRASPFGAAPIQVFLASSPCAASASSYHFSSSASPPWRSAFSQFAPVVKLGFPVLASGSNCAVKPTRLRRAAYFRSLACYAFACPPHRSCRCLSPSPKHALLGRCSAALRGCACGGPGHTVLAWLWSHLAHAVSLWGCVVFHPAANPAVKLTRQRRAAYFVR